MRLEDTLTYPRLMALFAASALIALVCVAAPAEAAPKKCFGKEATIVGTDRADTLRGTPGSDVIWGGPGEDRITGGGGDDYICGGHDFGDRALRGGGGNDSIHGGRGIEDIYGGAGDDLIRAGCGDCYSPIEDLSQLFGGPGNDRIIGEREQEEIFGGDGADRLIGGGSTNTELEGPDLLDGGPGDDRIEGGYNRHVDSGNGTTALGQDGNDFISDIDGGTSMVGGPGDDMLRGAPPDEDLLPFETCCSRVDYSTAPGPVDIDLVAGVAIGDGTDTLQYIRQVTGSAFDDNVRADGRGQTLNGGPGNDDLAGGGGDDTLEGDEGNDTFDGGAGRDLVSFIDSDGVTVDLDLGTATGRGADTLSGIEDVLGSFLADDVIVGNDADNYINALQGSATLIGGGGNDELVYDGSGGTLDGGPGDDLMSTDFFGGSTTFIGGEGDDEISVTREDDEVDGGPGRDLVVFESGPVDVDLAAGIATGGTGTDSLTGIEDVRGSTSSDVIRGDEDPNHLVGLDRNDQIFGRGGDDVLDGGTDSTPRRRGEQDLADGGEGIDVCRRAEELVACEG